MAKYYSYEVDPDQNKSAWKDACSDTNHRILRAAYWTWLSEVFDNDLLYLVQIPSLHKSGFHRIHSFIACSDGGNVKTGGLYVYQGATETETLLGIGIAATSGWSLVGLGIGGNWTPVREGVQPPADYYANDYIIWTESGPGSTVGGLPCVGFVLYSF